MVAIVFCKTVRASSLLEVIVAMVLMTIIFGIAMMIFTNVTQLSLSATQIRATALVNQQLIETEHTAYPANAVFQNTDIKIEVKLAAVAGHPGIQQIIVTAYDNHQKKIAVQKKLIPGHDE